MENHNKSRSQWSTVMNKNSSCHFNWFVCKDLPLKSKSYQKWKMKRTQICINCSLLPRSHREKKKQEKNLTRAVKLHSSLTTQTKLSNFTNFSIKNIWNSCLKGYALWHLLMNRFTTPRKTHPQNERPKVNLGVNSSYTTFASKGKG